MRIPKTLAIVLAGGEGSRLGALTEERAKPALPIGGHYRLIDVALSNLAHSHLSDVWIVQQYLPHSLNQHLAHGRPWDLDRSHGGLLVRAPYEGGAGEGFAHGNSDSLYRQREAIAQFDPELVLVLSADHLYTCNFLDVISTHLDRGADLTVVTTEVAEPPTRYGVVQTGEFGEVRRFDYKPDDPEGRVVAAEVFLYSWPQLRAAMDTLVAERGELADYGDDLVPWFVENRRVVEHRMPGYWLDLGTVQSYWTAHLQLLDGDGATLDDPHWPIWTAQPQLSPARVAASADVSESFLAAGARVAGTVRHSVVGPGAVVEEGAVVQDSVLLAGCRVASGVELVNCIVDEAAQLVRGGVRGSAGHVTLIGADGRVAERHRLDSSAVLPRGFG